MDLSFRIMKLHSEDTILFRRRYNGTFLVRFVDGSLPNTVWVSEKTKEELMTYIESTLLFFRLDTDPFEKIQINIPSHPVILLNKNLITEEVAESLLDVINEYVHNPPASFRQ